jgi:predicted AlkP superfamily phosphohydrolase/phosphomutase
MKGKKSKKLYLVGIDSTPLWIIKKLEKRWGMGGFRIFGDALVEITSTVPPVTGAAWPTIYTGLEPKEHGVIEFSGITRNYEKQLLYYESAKHPPFWDTLAHKGLHSLVVTPAVALEKSGYGSVDMITGWPLQPRFSSSRIERISRTFKFEGEPDIGNALNTEKLSLAEATRLYTESTKKRAELSKYLIEHNDYDMAFVCFTETDRIQHYSLNLKEWEGYVAPLYAEISKFLSYLDSRVKKRGEEAAIMVVSDHGAQQIHHKFLTNSWLVQKGYATLKDSVHRRAEANGSTGTVSKLRKKIADTLVESKFRRQIYTKMPASLRKIGENLVDSSFDYESQGRYTRIKESDFDMRNTAAFSCSSGTMSMIWINDSRFATPYKGKAKGTVSKEIMHRLTSIKDAEGKRLVRNIYNGSDYFSDGGNIIPPDIVFELEPGYTSDFSGYLEKGLYTEPEINRRGEHTRMGIFGIRFYNGNAKMKKSGARGLALSNVAPTILSYFDIKDKATGGRSLI